MRQQRPVESTEDFKLRIAAILGDKHERIAGAPRPNPLLVRSKNRLPGADEDHQLIVVWKRDP
jgi:hypothetical protein